MLKEFKNFIGFVNDIIMPVVGHFAGGMDFASLKYVLSPAVVDASGAVTTPENAVRYGAWINTIINLIIVGFVLFMIVKAYTKMKKPAPDAPPAGPSDNDLLLQIRDLLKKK